MGIPIFHRVNCVSRGGFCISRGSFGISRHPLYKYRAFWYDETTNGHFTLEERGVCVLSLVIFFLAVVSTTALIALWFWEVRRKLRVHYSVVVSARGQMETFERRAAATATGDKDVTAVLRRCRSIYRQAAENYNAVLRNPLLGIPGHLMGFSEAPLD